MTIDLFIVLSVWTGAAAYAALSVFFVIGWIRRTTGRAALAASLISTAWFTTLGYLGPRPIVGLLEVTAYTAWMFLLARTLGVGLDHLKDPVYRSQVMLAGVGVALYAASLVCFLASPWMWVPAMIEDAPPLAAFLRLGTCLLGLVLIEQVFRNTRRDARWNLKFLTTGLGVLFGYGFVLHADAALFRATSLTLYAPHGFVAAAATPFIAIASARSGDKRLSFNLSRQFVFRSGILIAAGLYLLAMGTAGYYVRVFGGEWGSVMQTLVIVAGLMGLVVLATSTEARSWLRVRLLRNLYEYKYDYREEWLRVTRELTVAHPDESLAQRAIHALTDLVHSSTGRYYRLSEQGVLLPLAEIRSARTLPLSPRTSASLAAFSIANNWIIDLDEYRGQRLAYPGLDLEADIDLFRGDRFIVPLPVQDELFGIIVLGRPVIDMELSWEDYELLRMIARQAAGFLALQHADVVLSESAQFRAMDQLSAFVVHDLKTISAQLSLLLKNATRHKTNPAFIDDMLKTTENSVGRMNRLLAQLRERRERDATSHCDLTDVARSAIEVRSEQRPVPLLDLACEDIEVAADREQLINVVCHIIQNAQEATPEDGNITLAVQRDAAWATVTVKDTGAGMSQEFLDRELFTPFATTKGVAGIGIGAYQSREFLRSIGGDLTARSELGKGSEFILRIPIPAPRAERAA